MKKTNGIRIRLVVVVVLIISLFFTAIVVVASAIISSKTVAEANDHYQLLADETGEKINAWLASKKEIVENQRAAVEAGGDFEIEYLSHFLAQAIIGRKDHNEICDLYFVDPDNGLASANGFYLSPDIDLRERDWYQSCLVTRDMFISTPYCDLSTGRYVVTASLSVNDSKGRFMGVIAIDLYIDAFLNAVNMAQVPDNSYIFLLDNKLGLAVHPNPDFGYIDNQPQPLSSIKGDIYSELGYYASRGKNPVIEVVDYDGVKRDFFSGSIASCGWYAVAAVSDDVIHSSQRLLTVAMAIALFLSVAVGAFWTLMGTRGLMHRLEAAMEEANSANETKSSFLANMSHEIRTPINAVIGMNEMILRENRDENITGYALDIAAASRSLIGIINDILDFSKIESGKLELIETEFNVASMINDVVMLSMSRLGEKPLELLVNVDPDIPSGLVGDEIRIKQIIVNLMTNGIKYTNDGYVALRVSCARREYGINLNVSVKDSGIGITPENIEKLFTSFQQVDTKRNRAVEGTGLGLAITKRLVERMGGFVNVDSKYGAGSEFRVSVPLKVSDNEPFAVVRGCENIRAVCFFRLDIFDAGTKDRAARDLMDTGKRLHIDMKLCSERSELERLLADGGVNMLFTDRCLYIENEKYLADLSGKMPVFLVQGRVNAINPSGSIRSIFKPFYALSLAAALNNDTADADTGSDTAQSGFTAPEAKVLIVDDNLINLKVAAGLMKPYGMQIFTADSGEKAIGMLEESPDFTIVFMDHMMPKMDGIEATGIIRAKGGEYFSKVPIIALTANTVNNARNMFLSSGFDDFLGKPIDTGMLDRVLRRFIPSEMRIHSTQKAASDAPSRSISSEPRAVSEFDPQTGISYTGGDEGLYLEILADYTKGGKTMRETLARDCAEKDWDDYIIKVHALKSTSLNIGAVPLAELAKASELAGKAGDFTTVTNGVEELFAKLDTVLGLTSAYLAEHGVNVSVGEENEDGETDISGLEPITREELDELIQLFLNACDDFDRDTAAGIAEEASGKRCGDTALSDCFRKAGAMIEDFEFDEAAELISGLKEGDAQ